MRVTEKMTSDNAIYNINKSQNRLNQLNELLSSNQNINRPSDDPIGTRQILDMQSQVRAIDQYMSNIQNGQTWTDVANTALQGMNDFLVLAKSAASNILGGMNDPISVLNALATLENVRQQMIDLANVQVGGQYVFGGFNNDTPVVSNKTLGGVVDVSKTANQITVEDTDGLIVGMTVSGKGILADTTITKVDTINKIVTLSTNPMSSGNGFDYTFGLPPTTQTGNTSLTGSQYQITGLASTVGLNIGDAVSGPGVPTGTTIASIDSLHQIRLDKALTVASPSPTGGSFTIGVAAPQTGYTSFSSAQITGLDTTNLTAGMTISGTGVPSGTTITSVDSASQITLSQPLTQAVTGGTFTFIPTTSKTGSTTALTNTITGLADVTDLSVGMSVLGPNIPDDTKIVGIFGTTIKLNNNATLTAAGGTFTFGPTVTKEGTTDPPNQITGLPLAQLQNLYIGMKVTGPGIPDNTTITDIDTTDNNGTGSVTLSKIPTGPGGAGQFVFEGYIASYGDRTMMGTVTNTSSSISGLPSTTNMINAPAVSKTGSTNPSVNPNRITGLADTNGLTVGMVITDNAGGTIIPPNTIVTEIDPVSKSITLSNPFIPPTTKAGVTDLTGMTSSVDLTGAGSGAGGITIVTANGNTYTAKIGEVAGAALIAGKAAPAPLYININGADTQIGTYTTDTAIAGGNLTNISYLANPVSVNVGGGVKQPITFTTNAVFNTAINNVGGTPPTNTAGSVVAVPKNQITGIDTTNLFVGMTVTGPGIPANTTITGTPTSIPPTATGSVTLSNTPTSASPAGGSILSIALTGGGAGGSTVVTDALGASITVNTALTNTNAITLSGGGGGVATTAFDKAGAAYTVSVKPANTNSVVLAGGGAGLTTTVFGTTGTPHTLAFSFAAGNVSMSTDGGASATVGTYTDDGTNFTSGVTWTTPQLVDGASIALSDTLNTTALIGATTATSAGDISNFVGAAAAVKNGIYTADATTVIAANVATTSNIFIGTGMNQATATLNDAGIVGGLLSAASTVTSAGSLGYSTAGAAGPFTAFGTYGADATTVTGSTVAPGTTIITGASTPTITADLSGNLLATATTLTDQLASSVVFSFAPTTLSTSTGVSFNFTQPIAKTGNVAAATPNQITGLADTSNLFVGMPVSDNAGGTIIRANTTITAIDTLTNTVTLSNPLLVTPLTGTEFFFTPTMPKITPSVYKTGNAVSGLNQITGLANTDSLFVGMPVTDETGGTIIPPNTTITDINSTTKTITLSNPALATPAAARFFFSPAVAGLNTIAVDTANLFVGMPVTGPGIPANTTITDTPTSNPLLATGTVTLSKASTLTSSSGTFYFGQYSYMNVSGTGVTPNPTIGTIVSSNSLNISAAATTATSSVGGTELTFTGHFAAEDIKVNINKSSQVALNYSVSKLLLGGAPPATTQASGPPPSTLPVNILGTIGELITAIQNKDDAGVIAAASNLKTATDQITLAQTEYAGRAIRLESAQTMLANNQNTLKNIISNKQTLDTATTIILLQQQTTAYQAALQGTAKILSISLMDYLK